VSLILELAVIYEQDIYSQDLKRKNNMSTISITEILGTDSISGSRNTLNSNFITLENWVNSYSINFGLDVNNGILDISNQPTGKVSAKVGQFNAIQVPTGSTAAAQILSTGAASFTSVATTNLTGSGNVTFSGTSSFTSAGSLVVGGTASFNSRLNVNSSLSIGPAGNTILGNTTITTGLTAGQAFPVSNNVSLSGGGVTTSVNSPYAITGTENVIYADCGPTGFYMKVAEGSGATASNLPDGFTLTIVNTKGATGSIRTGVTGASPYYTGFNTSAAHGNWPSAGIVVNANSQYQAAITLRWEPRIALTEATQKGSWVVLGATNMTF
jgi:hypothetical protein